MRRVLPWALAVAGTNAALPGCQSCTFEDLTFSAAIDGATSVAFHVVVPDDEVSGVSGSYAATLIDRSTEHDCAAAFYRFADTPDPAAIPAASVDDPGPEMIAGGGERRGWVHLPATGAHAFEVTAQGDGGVGIAIGGDSDEHPAFDEWIVIALCTDAVVDLDLMLSFEPCERGRRSGDVVEVTRAW